MKKIIKKIKIILFNKINKTKIYSTKADLNASYGKNTMVSSNTYIGKDVTLGDYTYVNSNSTIENAVIGKFCSISSGVYISPYEHKSEYISTSPYNRYYSENRKKVIIGNDVLISLNVIIKQGVRIGDGAIIGAGSIVTKDVQPYEVVVGIPAKHLRFRFDKEKISYLLDLKWWNRDFFEIKKNKDFFNNLNLKYLYNGESNDD